MEINGEPAENRFQEMLEDLKNEMCTPEAEAASKERLDKFLEKEREDRLVRSNDIANVPKRFHTVRFSDHPEEFTEKARQLCLDKNSDRILLLFGSVGRGKTTLLCSAIHERAYEGLNGSLYYSMLNLEMDLRRCRNFAHEDDERKFINELSEIPFLCIDEVGACLDRREEAYFLRRVLCQRYDNQLPTWIATNLSPSSFKALLCNIDLEGKTQEERKEICDRLDKENVVLNRIKSVVIPLRMVGESYRSVADNGSTI